MTYKDMKKLLPPDVLERKAIAFPINSPGHHWSLSALVNVKGVLAAEESEEELDDGDREGSAILTLNSGRRFKGSEHSKKSVRKQISRIMLLVSEWKLREGGASEGEVDTTLKTIASRLADVSLLPTVELAVEQQMDAESCGVFLCLYILWFVRFFAGGGAFTVDELRSEEFRRELSSRASFSDESADKLREKLAQLMAALSVDFNKHAVPLVPLAEQIPNTVFSIFAEAKASTTKAAPKKQAAPTKEKAAASKVAASSKKGKPAPKSNKPAPSSKKKVAKHQPAAASKAAKKRNTNPSSALNGGRVLNGKLVGGVVSAGAWEDESDDSDSSEDEEVVRANEKTKRGEHLALPSGSDDHGIGMRKKTKTKRD